MDLEILAFLEECSKQTEPKEMHGGTFGQEVRVYDLPTPLALKAKNILERRRQSAPFGACSILGCDEPAEESRYQCSKHDK